MLRILTLVISSSFSVMLMVGGIFIIRWFKSRESRKLEKYSYKTTAKIVRAYDPMSNQYQDIIVDGSVSYAPVYEYYYGGQYYTTVSKFGSSEPKFTIGSNTTIYINPQNPNDIYEPGVGNIVSKIGIVFGIILILFSAIPILTNIVTLFLREFNPIILLG